MLEKEYLYFKKHAMELRERYTGMFVVIVGESVDGAFPTAGEALSVTTQKHRLGTFLVQQVLENDEDYVQRFHSRVCF